MWTMPKLSHKPKLLLAAVILLSICLAGSLSKDLVRAVNKCLTLHQPSETRLGGELAYLVNFWFGPERFLLSLFFQEPALITEEIVPEELNSLDQAGTYLLASTLASLEPLETDSHFEFPAEELPLGALQETALLARSRPVTVISQPPRDEIITYIVQPGDIPSVIAARFGITTQTLLWANKLKETSLIRPGDELIILPVSGVLHRVKSGQTIGWIAKYYKAKVDEIIAFNDLPADGSIQIGQKLVIPGGQLPPPPRPQPRYVAAGSYRGPGTGQSHSYPYGQCTWYVAQKRYIPWAGHAYTWLAKARQYGFKTGSAPQVGAIIVTRESWYGHVGYVEAVQGNWVTFSEMNHLGWGIKDVRTLHINDYRIRGYIY